MNQGPLHQQQVFCHWTIKVRYHEFPQINISSIQNYQGLSFLPITFTGWQICSLNWDEQMNSYVGTLCIYLALLVKCKSTYNCCRIPGFESRVRSLLFFYADILNSNLVFIVLFGTSCVEFGTEVWLVPLGIM